MHPLVTSSSLHCHLAGTDSLSGLPGPILFLKTLFLLLVTSSLEEEIITGSLPRYWNFPIISILTQRLICIDFDDCYYFNQIVDLNILNTILVHSSLPLIYIVCIIKGKVVLAWCKCVEIKQILVWVESLSVTSRSHITNRRTDK